MATPRSFLLFLFVSSLLLIAVNLAVADDLDLDSDELSILKTSDDSDSPLHSDHGHAEFGDDAEFGDFDPDSYGGEGEDEPPAPSVDEKDVVVLTQANFTEFVGKNRHVMVEFYAPWCGHCQALAPEYAAAATELKGEDVALAKVDATEENELAQKYEVEGFPTVVFFVDGVHKTYPGARAK